MIFVQTPPPALVETPTADGWLIAADRYDSRDLVQSFFSQLRELEDVEILSATLQLGQMKFIAREAIPELVRTGQVIDGWTFALHGGEPA